MHPVYHLSDDPTQASIELNQQLRRVYRDIEERYPFAQGHFTNPPAVRDDLYRAIDKVLYMLENKRKRLLHRSVPLPSDAVALITLHHPDAARFFE